MSLWFQASPSNYDPTETRSIGFGQVKRGSSIFGDPQENETSQMSAAAGGITQNFSSKVSISPTIDTSFNFDGPYFNNNSLTLTNAINNNILQNFQVNNLMQTIENIVQLFSGGFTNYDARITALEAWRATGSTACSGGTVVAMEDWYYDDVDEIIQKVRSTFRIQEGLITSFDGSVDPTSSCPGGTPNGNEPISTCPP